MYYPNGSSTREKQQTRARAQFARQMMLTEFHHRYANPDIRDFVDRKPGERPLTAREAGIR